VIEALVNYTVWLPTNSGNGRRVVLLQQIAFKRSADTPPQNIVRDLCYPPISAASPSASQAPTRRVRTYAMKRRYEVLLGGCAKKD
jgi:hypothetical protein